MQILMRKTPEEMLQGMGLDSKQIQRVTLAIWKAVQNSFRIREELMTESESQRRVDFCFKESVRFIGDFDFTVREVEHRLPMSLRLHLIGAEYQPSDRLLKSRQTMI